MTSNMIDGDNSTLDWQEHSGTVCVLPVGAFEQHSTHLPLCTDIIGAEFFARMAAKSLGAALLPTLPIGTSLEHSGFRGSVSLRPETFMQMVRDIADEIERQRFRVLLIINGHGGNFSLGPVVRDINRRDRALKILLVNWYDFRDTSVISEGNVDKPDVHAGEMETSLMLALAPDLVGSQREDMPSQQGQEFPLSQSDLNTFGVGHFAPQGAVGCPSLATREKGEAVISAVEKRMIPYLQDRLARLKQQPKY